MSVWFVIALLSASAQCIVGQQVHVSDCGSARITAGQNCSLLCTLTGVSISDQTGITYQWSKNNGSHQVQVGTDSNVLSFPSLKLSDAGQYTCQVTVNSQMYGYSEYIHIQIPTPASTTVSSDPVSPIRPVGSNVTLTCTVELSPAVDVPVTVDIHLIDPTGRLLANYTSSMSSSIYTQSALVSSFGRNQSGSYTCTSMVSSTSLFVTDSERQNTTTNVTVGVYLSLRGTIYANNSFFFFTMIGEANTYYTYTVVNSSTEYYRIFHLSSPTSLECNTDRIPCCSSPYRSGRPRYGEWFFPNGSRVSILSRGDTSYRTRWSDGTVSLNRRNNSDLPATGLFCCVVPDAADIQQTLCANIVTVSITYSGMDTAGESYMLECSVKGANDSRLLEAKFQWLDEQGNPVVTKGSISTITNQTSGSYNLHFSPLQQNHEGVYTCNATIYGTSGFKSVNLTVNAPSIIVYIDDGGAVPTAGTSFKLTCTVFGAENLVTNMTNHWSVSNDTQANVTESSNSLFFDTLQLHDSGLYTCVVTIKSPYLEDVIVNSTSYQLLLELPDPVYIAVLSDKPNPIRPIGSDVALTCKVELNPALDSTVTAKIELTDPTTSLLTTISSVSGFTYTHTAMVSSFGREQSGEYTCTATTVSSSSQFLTVSKPLSQTIRLTTGVYLSMKGVFFPNNSLISIIDIGETIYDYSKLPLSLNNGLQCVTDLKPCCNSNFTVGEWYFPDGGQIPTQTVTSFYVNRGDDGSVTLNLANSSAVQAEHPTGTFCCSMPDATNTTQTSLCINILPEIFAHVSDGGTLSKAGERYMLICEVSGAENQNLILTYQLLKNNGTQKQLGTNSTSLLIPSLRLSDAGQYSCKVIATSLHYNGAVNIVSKNLDVQIQVPQPVVRLVSNTPNPILSGSSPTLTCTVELSPAVDVPVDITMVWTGPDGSTLTSDASPVMKSLTHYKSKLTLNYVELADSGNYTCTVSIRGKIRASVSKEIFLVDGTFQLRLINTDVCHTCCKCDKTDKDVELYKHSIEEALIEAIESRCECHFPKDHLFNATFICASSTNLATYRNSLIGTHNFNATQLIGFIQDWVTSRPHISINGFAVWLDRSCPVAIALLNDPECGEVSHCPCANDPNVAKCVEHIGNEDFTACINSCI